MALLDAQGLRYLIDVLEGLDESRKVNETDEDTYLKVAAAQVVYPGELSEFGDGTSFPIFVTFIPEFDGYFVDVAGNPTPAMFEALEPLGG